MTALTLQAHDLPGREIGHTGSNRVIAYFEMLCRKFGQAESCLFLPSVLAMARKLNCPAVEIHDTMRQLSEDGYRFIVLGLDSPVTLWYPRTI